MSLFQPKLEDDLNSDDDDDDITDDDLSNDGIYDMYDDADYDDVCDLNDTNYFSALVDSLLEATGSGLPQALSAKSASNYRVRSAMSLATHVSSRPTSSIPLFGDFINAYLFASPLNQRTTASSSYYLSFDPTSDTIPASDSLFAPELFVGNVPRNTIHSQLSDFFNAKGYSVKRVDLKSQNTGPGYAFVHFSSIEIATLALYDFEEDSSKFIFYGNKLRINRPTKSRKTKPTTTATAATLSTNNYDITDIHYGTLITGAAMRYIRKGNSIVSSCDQLGIIAHRFSSREDNFTFRLEIDAERRKLSIISRAPVNSRVGCPETSSKLAFEWSFRDLRGKKITPILINQTNGQKELFLLVEVKRPPIILKTQNISHAMYSKEDETRLPGTTLIGHANAWFFRLSPTNRDRHYEELFNILCRNNLTQRRFSGYNIISLIGTLEARRRNLESIQLISNDIWVQQNQVKVDEFLTLHWPSYPFETKFEIMKLISKHIITVHDLIVDEKAESILQQCSISTLIACTDKIVENAPRWFSATYDNDEDWDKDNEEEEEEDDDDDDDTSTVKKNTPVVNNGFYTPLKLRSSAGASVTVSNTEALPITTNMAKLSFVAREHRLGTLSRLLLFALNELRDKHELRREPNSHMYVTKHELRVTNANPFLIRKIYITPSTILYEGPYREEKCAVTRHYEDQQDRFLRVTFRDEDYRVLHNYNNNMTEIYKRIKQIMINGVGLCDRKYEFLAFSSSQLREHSCWMFASMDDGTSAGTIREWMGNFRNVRPVAKLAARLGQSFSTSIKGIMLESNQFRQISDVERYDEHGRELCFTDGIGIIAPWLAEKLIREVKPSDSDSIPSAFQIRCGGYKGMVCLDVAQQISQSQIGVYFRPSMNKFKTENYSIDVVHTSSSPSLAYLNRQIILLLSSLGIQNDVFIALQNRMLERSLALTGDPKKGCEALKEFNEFGGNGCHAFLIDYLRVLGRNKEPFARQLLLTVQAFLVKELRTKAKILVPNSWSLFGVVDETRTLNYGQVFIQIDDSNQEGGSLRILTGSVVVTRNPCFHPGDIRHLEAIDVPALHKLKNVIVFPMNGPRPHAMEMSGGDLDGDTFWVCHDKQLIFPNNEPPFDYQDQTIEAQKRAELDRNKQYTIEDVCNFFAEYIEADNLGLIANSHLAFADQLPRRAKDEKCLTLARMHSTAVDFAKNGVSVPPLTGDLRPKKYPHFMEKKDKEQYPSQTILGKLYDEIQSYKIDLNDNEAEEIDLTSTFPYASFEIDGYKDYVQDADVTKNEYDRELRRVMRQYGITHEGELVSGYILKFNSKQYAKETKLFELRNEISHAYRVIRDKYMRLFWEQFYQPTENESEEDIVKWSEVSRKLTWKDQLGQLDFYHRSSCKEDAKKKASAWFRVTYEPWRIYMNKYKKEKMKRQTMYTDNKKSEQQQQQCKGLFSFAWLVYPVLLNIYREKHNDFTDNTETKKKKRKRRKKKKEDSSTTSNGNKVQA